MDICYTRPINTPRVSQLRLKFETLDDMVTTMRSVESAYWDYTDNYNKPSPRRFPYYKLVDFLTLIMRQTGNPMYHLSAEIIKKYTKYKKSLATDGIILYTLEPSIKVTVVRVNGSKIWSMPKGKRESGEESLDCAVREFIEETGIDISDSASRDMDSVAIHKTNFFLLEADYAIPLKKYKTNEISGVKWADISDVTANSSCYSKQVTLVMEYLKDLAIY